MNGNVGAAIAVYLSNVFHYFYKRNQIFGNKIFYNNLSGSTLKLTLFEKSNCTEKYAIFVEISFHCTTLCCNFTLKLENETLFCTYFNSPQFTHFKKLNDTIFLN